MTNLDSIFKNRDITLPTKVRLVKAMDVSSVQFSRPVVSDSLGTSWTTACQASLHIHTKVCLVKGIVFPVVMYGCEGWTIKDAEHWRIDAFELWCWRSLLRVPWTARRSNQSILKEISPRCSLEGLMLKLKLQYLGTWCEELTHLKRLWCWERLRAGGEGDDRGWDGWMVSLTWWTWVWVNSGSWWWTGRPGMLWSMGKQSQTQLSNWSELN